MVLRWQSQSKYLSVRTYIPLFNQFKRILNIWAQKCLVGTLLAPEGQNFVHFAKNTAPAKGDF